MPYISELLNNRVTDSADVSVGKLQDILITAKEGTFAPLEFLVIKIGHDETRFVPYEFVANFTSSKISLKNIFNKIALTELPAGRSYVRLKKEILDKQIVDVAGTRVVRVNDLRIGSFENKTCVLAIDASFKGLLRRLGIADFFVAQIFDAKLIDWRQAKLLEGSAPLQLNTAEEQLSHLHPADLANLVEDLDVMHASNLLASLDSAEAAKVLEEVDPELQTVLVKYLGPEKAGKILSQMSSDELVDLIKTFSGGEAREFLSQVKSGKTQNLQQLISYPDNTAGGLMTLDMVTARPDWTVQQAIEEIRRASDSLRSIFYVYLTDDEGYFKGVLSIRRLLLADKSTVLSSMAKKFPDHSFLKPHFKMDEIIELMTKYNLYTALVLDKDKKLLGIVTIDDVMRQLFPTA